jgi:hypothetical protein
VSTDRIVAPGDLPRRNPRWAPWQTDLVTLHLVVEDTSHPYHAACATHDVHGRLHGPTLDWSRARELDEFTPGFVVCRTCVQMSHVRVALIAEDVLRAQLAYEIRSDLVCCDCYDVCRPSALNEAGSTNPAVDGLRENPAYHDLCYWGESIARYVEGRGEEDECRHEAGSWFDRTLCAEPCGKMHDRCGDCGEPLDSCHIRAQSYFTRHLDTYACVADRLPRGDDHCGCGHCARRRDTGRRNV